MRIKILALGKGGSNIATSWSEYAEETCYINTHRSEMKLLPGDFYTPDKDYVRNKNLRPVKLCVGDGRGTGRSPNAGRALAEQSEKEIQKFLRHNFDEFKGLILVLIGGGGGSGTGMSPLVCRLLGDLKLTFGIIYTLPQDSDGIPTIPNALDGLVQLERELQTYKVAPFFLADNELMLREEGEDDGDFWGAVNTRISRIMLFTQLINREITDIGTYNTIDEREFLRVFRLTKVSGIGYNDIKSFDWDADRPIESFKEGMKANSMSFCSGYDYRSADGVLVAVEQPEDHEDDSGALNELWKEIARRYKGKRVLKSVVPSDEYRVNILFSGLNAPLRLKKLNEKASKEVAIGKKKRPPKAKVQSVRGYSDEYDETELL